MLLQASKDCSRDSLVKRDHLKILKRTFEEIRRCFSSDKLLINLVRPPCNDTISTIKQSEEFEYLNAATLVRTLYYRVCKKPCNRVCFYSVLRSQYCRVRNGRFVRMDMSIGHVSLFRSIKLNKMTFKKGL